MLNYSLHGNLNSDDGEIGFGIQPTTNNSAPTGGGVSDFRIISEKIRVPEIERAVPRRRLTELLTKQFELFGATLVFGRAGTGKTTLAVGFSENYEQLSWFRVDSTDIDWNIFSRYLLSSFQKSSGDNQNGFQNISAEGNLETRVLKFLERLFSRLEPATGGKPFLIVLDDLHSVFDAPWFEVFFKGLLSFDLPNIHFLLLSRSKPPFPLLRLRSKQKLGVIEENLLLFTPGETGELLQKEGVSAENAKGIQKKTYGRISKIKQLTESA